MSTVPRFTGPRFSREQHDARKAARESLKGGNPQLAEAMGWTRAATTAPGPGGTSR